jgi:hypothetical protein
MINQEFMTKMTDLNKRTKNADPDLKRAISTQISVAKTWSAVVEQVIESMQDEQGD